MLVRLLICVFFSLAFAFPTFADSQTKSADQIRLEQANEKILVLEKELAIHKHTLQVSLDSYDKRVGDFSVLISKQSEHTTWIGILITALIFLISVIGYFNAAAKAKDVAQTVTDQWFKSNDEMIVKRMKSIEDQMSAFDLELEKNKKLVSESLTKAVNEMDASKYAVSSYAKEIMQDGVKDAVDVSIKTENSSIVDLDGNSEDYKKETEKHAKRTASEAKSLDGYLEKLKIKPKEDFDDYDYFISGADFFNRGQFGAALDAINVALEKVKPESEIDHCKYLKSKAAVLEQLQYYEESRKVWDFLIQKYKTSEKLEFQELVAESEYKIISLFHKMKLLDKANEAYVDFLRKYAANRSEVISGLFARAIFDQATLLKNEHKFIDAIDNYDLVIDEFSNSSNENLKFLTMASQINRNSAINQFVKTPVAVDYYSEKIKQYKAAVEEENTKKNRIKLIEVLAFKAEALRNLKRENEALTIYSEMIKLFKQQSDSEVNYLIAGAFNAIGFTLLLKAKQNWEDFDQRTNLLDVSLINFESALKLSNDHNRPVILGNNGYTLFLLNRKDDARIVTEECLKQGGINALKTQLVDAKIDRVVAVDSAYEEWIKELSANLNLPNLEHL
nr:hypothetical protein [uncultured Undibacterium sp.]